MRNAQVYLRCILGGKSLEPPVFTLESGKVTKVTFIRCHLQCYAPRRWGHINSKCRTHQFLMSDTSIRGIGSTRFVCGIGSTRFICSIGSTRFFVASVRHGFLWHRFDAVCLCGIGSTRFVCVASVVHGLFGASVRRGSFVASVRRGSFVASVRHGLRRRRSGHRHPSGQTGRYPYKIEPLLERNGSMLM